MAHPCFSCGSECYCHGDIDDVIVSNTLDNCDGCGCEGNIGYDCEEWDDDFWDDDEDDFTPCCECDGHDACRDFGCAIEAGLGHLVKTDL